MQYAAAGWHPEHQYCVCFLVPFFPCVQVRVALGPWHRHLAFSDGGSRPGISKPAVFSYNCGDCFLDVSLVRGDGAPDGLGIRGGCWPSSSSLSLGSAWAASSSELEQTVVVSLERCETWLVLRAGSHQYLGRCRDLKSGNARISVWKIDIF